MGSQPASRSGYEALSRSNVTDEGVVALMVPSLLYRTGTAKLLTGPTIELRIDGLFQMTDLVPGPVENLLRIRDLDGFQPALFGRYLLGDTNAQISGGT